jgi:hypothetical protein
MTAATLASFDVLAEIRIGVRLGGDVVETKMFAGIAFMVAGRMACGVVERRSPQ